MDDQENVASETYPCYIKVGDDEDAEVFMELPTENDGSILLSTIQAQYPCAIGLKFQSSSGSLRGVKISDNILYPPFDGWGDRQYTTAVSKQDKDTTKRKINGLINSGPEAKHVKTGVDYLSDLIVLGLPYKATEEDLKDHFSKYGELAMQEVKYDASTKKSKGFGFIRFEDADAALHVVKSDHFIMGRRCEVRLPKRKDDLPMKLFVGRLPEQTQQDDLRKYFADFGELVDVYVPAPFRGFGFVTFASTAVARHVLNQIHMIKGSNVNVTYAEPKKQQNGEKQGVSEDPPFNFEDMRNVMQMNTTTGYAGPGYPLTNRNKNYTKTS